LENPLCHSLSNPFCRYKGFATEQEIEEKDNNKELFSLKHKSKLKELSSEFEKWTFIVFSTTTKLLDRILTTMMMSCCHTCTFNQHRSRIFRRDFRALSSGP
jgi:hypothetical protein